MPSEQMQLSICSCRESLEPSPRSASRRSPPATSASRAAVDLLPPCVVTAVAEPMRKPDVVRGEVTSVHLQSRIVVGRRLPIGTRRSRVEIPTTPEAVALGRLSEVADPLSNETTEQHRLLSGCSKRCSIPDHAGAGARGHGSESRPFAARWQKPSDGLEPLTPSLCRRAVRQAAVLVYRPVRAVLVAVVGGERCSSLYRLLVRGRGRWGFAPVAHLL
jgi:hypothetical protein